MATIKYNITFIKGLSIPGIITFTDARIINMEECVVFLPEPSPTVANMTTRRNNLQTRQATYKSVPSELNKQNRDKAYDELIEGHISWIAYGESIIGDDEDKANLFGYPQYQKRSEAEIPEGTPPKPTIILTPNPGEIILNAKVYKQGTRRILYNWQISEDGGVTYNYLPTIGNSHRRRIKLELGKQYCFRVAYATVAGEGLFSEKVEITLTRDMVGKEKKKKKAA